MAFSTGFTMIVTVQLLLAMARRGWATSSELEESVVELEPVDDGANGDWPEDLQTSSQIVFRPLFVTRQRQRDKQTKLENRRSSETTRVTYIQEEKPSLKKSGSLQTLSWSLIPPPRQQPFYYYYDLPSRSQYYYYASPQPYNTRLRHYQWNK